MGTRTTIDGGGGHGRGERERPSVAVLCDRAKEERCSPKLIAFPAARKENTLWKAERWWWWWCVYVPDFTRFSPKNVCFRMRCRCPCYCFLAAAAGWLLERGVYQKGAASLYSLGSMVKKSSSFHWSVSKVGRRIGSLFQHSSMISYSGVLQFCGCGIR